MSTSATRIRGGAAVTPLAGHGATQAAHYPAGWRIPS